MNVRAQPGQSDRARSCAYCGSRQSAPIAMDCSGLFARGHLAPVEGLDSARAVAQPVGHIEGPGRFAGPQVRHRAACLLGMCQLKGDVEVGAQIR